MTTLLRVHLQARITATFQDPHSLQTTLGDITLPDDLSSWLSRLMLLKGVPFSYLVPDETMLPPESIRFFTLDANWMEALLDGAFSIGRNLTNTTSDANVNLDRALLPAVRSQTAPTAATLRANMLGQPEQDVPAAPTVITGFVLRSTLVARYPNLGVNAYPQGGTPNDGDAMNPLPLLRLETLGPTSDTLLCLLGGDACQVDIHEAPEHLHYGIDSYSYDANANAVTAKKVLRTFTRLKPTDPNVTLTGNTVPLDLNAAFRSSSPRVLKISAIAAQIAAANNIPTLDAAEMGFEMTQGVGMVSFRKEP